MNCDLCNNPAAAEYGDQYCEVHKRSFYYLVYTKELELRILQLEEELKDKDMLEVRIGSTFEIPLSLIRIFIYVSWAMTFAIGLFTGIFV